MVEKNLKSKVCFSVVFHLGEVRLFCAVRIRRIIIQHRAKASWNGSRYEALSLANQKRASAYRIREPGGKECSGGNVYFITKPRSQTTHLRYNGPTSKQQH